MTHVPAPAHPHDVLAELGTRLQAQRADAAAVGLRLRSPLLLLGTSERVGSNWLSDTLRPLMGQHNEPLRQQLGPAHPFSTLNPNVATLTSTGLDPERLKVFGRHWLLAFALSKHTPVRQVVKETNLFFALPLVLALFADSPVAVLTRSPLGIASSFARSDLFRRWGYRARYQQLVATTQRAYWRTYAPLVPDDAPGELVTLVRMQVLATVLLAAGVAGRDVVQVPYETSVICRAGVLGELAELLPEASPAMTGTGTGQSRAGSGVLMGGEDTFVTTVSRPRLLAHLDSADAELVRASTAAAMTTVRQIVPEPVAARASAWLGGDHLYTLAATPTPSLTPARTPARPPVSAGPTGGAVPVAYLRRADLCWRNLLVTNHEYAAFLNDLHAAGLANDQGGTYLLAVPMPHERGGRLHQDTDTGRWHVSAGFEQHPVYWVTWIGAATFAAHHGARLPTRAELIDRSRHGGTRAMNSDYGHGDVSPVTEPGRSARQIHHLVGNVQVWCGDGPDLGTRLTGPQSRWLHGAAWNTPSTPEEIHRPRDRHLTGASRGIGIRLVRDRATHAAVPAGRLAGLLRAWLDDLADAGVPLGLLDERLIAALFAVARPNHRVECSEADGGLGSLVRPGAGEPGQGQVPECFGEPVRGQVGERHELHTADRAGVSTSQDLPDGAPGAGRLEGQVHDVGVAAGQVVTHVQQSPDGDVDPGLLAHLADQCLGQGLALLDLPARQRPGPAGVGVLIEQQDLPVLDDHARDANLHSGESTPADTP